MWERFEIVPSRYAGLYNPATNRWLAVTYQGGANSPLEGLFDHSRCHCLEYNQDGTVACRTRRPAAGCVSPTRAARRPSMGPWQSHPFLRGQRPYCSRPDRRALQPRHRRGCASPTKAVPTARRRARLIGAGRKPPQIRPSTGTLALQPAANRWLAVTYQGGANSPLEGPVFDHTAVVSLRLEVNQDRNGKTRRPAAGCASPTRAADVPRWGPGRACSVC